MEAAQKSALGVQAWAADRLASAAREELKPTEGNECSRQAPVYSLSAEAGDGRPM
jgi:hypothetical protein